MIEPAAPAIWPPSRARVAWMFFDWAAQPFFTLVTTFVFAPFFAAALAPDPIRGQELWGYATGAAGLLIALASPVLGSISDAAGPRKPWIAAFGGMMALGCVALWFAAPGASYAVPLALFAFAVATIGAEFASVFNNAMMPRLAPPDALGRLSGRGWAMGYAGGLLSLVLVLGFMAASPETGKTMLGLDPILGLDPTSREGDRASGPFSALWFLVFVLPMFLFVPDVPRPERPSGEAARQGLRDLAVMLRGLSDMRDLARFLLSNMIVADGLAALFAFAGIYGAGVFGWGAIEIGVFGILLTITGTVGAVAGGRLDDVFGPRSVIIGSLAVLIVAAVGIVGTERTTALFAWPSSAPDAGDGLYATLSERVYVGLGLLIGVVAGPMQAAARTLLVRLAPPDRVGQCFGLFALSGKATSFVGPMLVALATGFFASQRAGLAVLILFFAAGIVLMLGIREKRQDRAPVPTGTKVSAGSDGAR
jgi:UMF1 family MFS transporter